MWHNALAKETHGPSPPPTCGVCLRGSEPIGPQANFCAKHIPADPGKEGLEGIPGRPPAPPGATPVGEWPLRCPAPPGQLANDHPTYSHDPTQRRSTACGAEKRTRGRPQDAARPGTEGTGVADLVSAGTRPPFALVAPSSFQLRSHPAGGSVCLHTLAVGLPA